MKKISCLLIAFTLLLGCESTENKHSEVTHVQTVSKKEALPYPAELRHLYVSANKSVETKAFLMRDYLYADKDLPAVHYNLMLFSKRPIGVEEHDRYRLLCELWQGMYSEYDSSTVLPSGVKLIPFYWMLTKRQGNYSCDFLIENYDYERAQLYILAEDLKPNSMYLVFEIPSGLVTMDLTKIKSNEDLILAMDVWQNKMRHIPKEETSLSIYTIGYSAKLLLGALGDLIAMK